MKLKETIEYRVGTEKEAIEFINGEREKAKEMGYDVLKASYTLKTKKAKGEIVDLGYLVSITYEYITFWEV